MIPSHLQVLFYAILYSIFIWGLLVLSFSGISHNFMERQICNLLEHKKLENNEHKLHLSKNQIAMYCNEEPSKSISEV